MKKKFLGAAVALAAVVLVAAPATSASAGTVSAGGGLWDYGVGTVNVWSKYHHATKYHSATACNGNIWNECRKAVAEKNKWASATIGKTPSGGNTAYWNTY